MCTVCGCGAGETKVEGEVQEHSHEHIHVHEDGTVHSHAHEHGESPLGVHSHTHRHADGGEHSHAHTHAGEHAHHHEHGIAGDLDYGTGPARAHAPGLSQSRMVQIEQDILGKNNDYAAANRQWFNERGILVLNLVSSPGSGKTTLLVKVIDERSHRFVHTNRGKSKIRAAQSQDRLS